MAKFHKGKYTVINEEKYSGNGSPVFRSSWEQTFMQFCDNNPNVMAWASEPVRITYKHPLTGKLTSYVTDFVVVYRDSNGKKNAELIEIKPANQSNPKFARCRAQQAQVAINYAKWDAATHWAKKRGMKFRVLNEGDIYSNTKKPKAVKKPKKPIKPR